jgi:hydroxyethylthiazole kinase-like uncharacterized protein yjeF
MPSPIKEPTALDALGLIKRLKRNPSEHKGDAGKLLMVGGSPGMLGALVLAGNAALHLGAGWTILEALDPAASSAINEHPELMIKVANDQAAETLISNNPDLIAIGPGLGNSLLAHHWVSACIDFPRIPLVIDADALNLIAHDEALFNRLQKRNQHLPGLSVITPHPGEAARLLKQSTEQVQGNRLESINRLVELTGSIVVLKGQHTLIQSPEHQCLQCNQGNPGMGTGGMGDVLTGSIAALASQGIRHHLDLWSATGIAVQLHAEAADSLVRSGVGPIGLTPSETILEMRKLLNSLT